MLRARPDFLIIGAQKAATTSLYAWLTHHPDVLAAQEKELHYFDSTATTADIDAYWRAFPLRPRMAALRRRRGRAIVTGEATPVYLFDPRVPRMVADQLPEVRIIVVLRDPVDRAISHYWMEVNRGHESLTLEDALSAEQARLEPDRQRIAKGEPPGLAYRRWSYVARGRYAEQLQRWLGHFPRDQMLVLRFDDLVGRPHTAYRTALEFIGADPDAAAPPLFTVKNPGTRRETSPDTVRWLEDQFLGPNEALRELVGVEFDRGG